MLLRNQQILDEVTLYWGLSLEDIPIVPKIDAKMLASIERHSGTNGLDMSNWHNDYYPDGQDLGPKNYCKTAHCRAGYAVCLGGAKGFALEEKASTAVAGTLIYILSTPDEPVPSFYVDNKTAMRDIRARAKRQRAKRPANTKPPT